MMINNGPTLSAKNSDGSVEVNDIQIVLRSKFPNLNFMIFLNVMYLENDTR